MPKGRLHAGRQVRPSNAGASPVTPLPSGLGDDHEDRKWQRSENPGKSPWLHDLMVVDLCPTDKRSRHATEPCHRCRPRHVRKSVVLFAAVAVVAAVIAAVVGLWLPARDQRQDAAWTAAGERALAHVALPSSYAVDPQFQCGSGPHVRCLLGPGNPEQQVATVKAALAAVTTGPVKVSCYPVKLPASPPTCHLSVPVAGSRLVVALFAHPRDSSKNIAQRTYDGAYVQMWIDHR